MSALLRLQLEVSVEAARREDRRFDSIGDILAKMAASPTTPKRVRHAIRQALGRAAVEQKDIRL